MSAFLAQPGRMKLAPAILLHGPPVARDPETPTIGSVTMPQNVLPMNLPLTRRDATLSPAPSGYVFSVNAV